MNILYLCHRIPYPPNKGDKIRSFNEVKYLSKKHKIYLAFLIDDRKDLPYVNELKKYCETIDYDFIHPGWQKIKSLPYLLSRKPFTVPYFYSKKLQKAVDYRLSTIKFDAIFAFSSPMAEYVFKSKAIQLTPHPSPLPSGERGRVRGGYPKLIIDFVDVDSDKWRMYAEYSKFPKTLIYKNEWKSLMAYEKKIGKAFDISIFVSDAEVKLFKSFAPDVNAISIPNGVDFSYFSNTTNKTIMPDEQKDFNILFTGAMDYFPNEDGVLYFYYKIWPIIKDKLPQSKFYIVGGNPSKKLKTITGKDKDVLLTGYVDDVRQYVWKADVFVAPLRIARGIQNKILEALAAGLPVVATSRASQGIGCNGNEFLFIENSAGKFAERTISFADKHLSGKAVEKRESFLKQKYDWSGNLIELEKILNIGGTRYS